jgi:hypothetical protein
MRNAFPPPLQRDRYGRQLREALDRIEVLLVDGLRHGFFDCSITCEVGKERRRQLVVRAGKNHKFTIPEDDLPL